MKNKLIIIDENKDIYLVEKKIALEDYKDEEIYLGVGCDNVEEILEEIKYIFKRSEEK